MTHIVFVCTANICRSPMAEGIFRHAARCAGRNDLTASSMGIHGMDGAPASASAQLVCAEKGVDIAPHRSRSVTGEDMQRADLILCMEPGHAKHMKTFYPWHRDRVFLLGAWPGKPSRRSTIKDPIGAPVDAYRATYDIIETHIQRVMEHL